MVGLFQPLRWHRCGEHRQHDLEKCEKVLCFVANERFGMTHHPVGCFGEISLKLEPFRNFKGCGTSKS